MGDPFSSGAASPRLSSDPSPLAVSAVTAPERLRRGGVFRLHVQVVIAPGSHIYSLTEGQEENLATRIGLRPSTEYAPAGGWEENAPEVVLDEVLQKTVRTHSGLAEFTREFRVSERAAPGEKVLSGDVSYRLCDNRVCSLPKSLGFSATIIIE